MMVSRLKIKNQFFIALIVFISFYETPSFADEEIIFEPHVSIIPQLPSWREAEFKHFTIFGGYIFDANRAGRTASSESKYTADPIGPIVAIWTITRYLGEKVPERKECSKEPKYPSSMNFSKVEYDKAIKDFTEPFNTYIQCRKDLCQQLEEEETRTTYYARSTNNYKPVLPPSSNQHLFYKIEGGFGDLGGVPLKALTKEQKLKKNQLIPTFCLYAHHDKDKKECFRLSDNEDTFYYKMRSVIEIKKKGSVPTHSQYPVELTESPQNLNEIKGIKITQKQAVYLMERCKISTLNCYLDNAAPDLNTEQKAFIKATAWDIDTDEQARKAFIKKADGYIGH